MSKWSLNWRHPRSNLCSVVQSQPSHHSPVSVSFLITKCKICSLHLTLLSLLWEFKEPGHTNHLACCLSQDAPSVNTSYIYIHHYPCHGNHHFPTETIFGESSYEDSIFNLMLSESGLLYLGPDVECFYRSDSDLHNLSWEALFADDSQASQGKGWEVWMVFFSLLFPSFLLPCPVTCLLVSGLLTIEMTSKATVHRSLLGGWSIW